MRPRARGVRQEAPSSRRGADRWSGGKSPRKGNSVQAKEDRRALTARRGTGAIVAYSPHVGTHRGRLRNLHGKQLLESHTLSASRCMSATSSQLHGALMRAGQLLLAGELEQAAAACRSILQGAPDQPAAIHMLGLAQARLGAPAEAEPLLRRSLSLEPANQDFRLNFGNFLRDLGRLTEAEAEYRGVLAQVPGASKARHQLALTLADLGRHAEAESEARQTLAADPRDAESWSLLGYVLANQGRLLEA